MFTCQALHLTHRNKMLCSQLLIAKLWPVSCSARLAHKTNSTFPLFSAACENSLTCYQHENDDVPLSNVANTETNACYKILRAGYCLLVVTQENIFSRCTITEEYIFSISHLPNFFSSLYKTRVFYSA